MSRPWHCSRPERRLVHWGAALVSLVLGVGLPGTARAGAECSITSVALAFGVYDPAAPSPDDTATTVTVTCVYVPPSVTSVGYTIALSNGMHGTDAATRQMASGSSRLAYNVFNDASRTRVWGMGNAGTVVATGSMTVGPGVGNGTRTATHTVYGRVPSLQDAVPGTYLDSLVLTLVY
jgi:Uncharacterized secreted protein